jgi:hypothetical protein
MIKAKELKDDAILNIQINKSYYMMAKASSFTILKSMNITDKNPEYFKDLMSKKYEELDEMQRVFYTLILLLSEAEKQATENKLYNEKEILEPGDKNYVEPTLD